MIDTNEWRKDISEAIKEPGTIDCYVDASDALSFLDEIDQLRTTLQHATEDKAKTLAILQQLHMKRADPHNTQELLEFYLETHLLIRNLLKGVPMKGDSNQ